MKSHPTFTLVLVSRARHSLSRCTKSSTRSWRRRSGSVIIWAMGMQRKRGIALNEDTSDFTSKIRDTGCRRSSVRARWKNEVRESSCRLDWVVGGVTGLGVGRSRYLFKLHSHMLCLL